MSPKLRQTIYLSRALDRCIKQVSRVRPFSEPLFEACAEAKSALVANLERVRKEEAGKCPEESDKEELRHIDEYLEHGQIPPPPEYHRDRITA